MRIAILALLLFSLVYAVPANYTLVKTTTVNIPANVPWTNTSVYIHKDEYLVLSANGKWRYDPRPQFEVGPDGLVNTIQSTPLGRLIGKIDSKEAFDIGTHWEGDTKYEGWLYLGMYDTTPYENNIGSLQVTVQVYNKKIENNTEKTNETQVNITSEKKEKNETPQNTPEKIEEKTCNLLPVLVVILLLSMIVIRHTIDNMKK